MTVVAEGSRSYAALASGFRVSSRSSVVSVGGSGPRAGTAITFTARASSPVGIVTVVKVVLWESYRSW